MKALIQIFGISAFASIVLMIAKLMGPRLSWGMVLMPFLVTVILYFVAAFLVVTATWITRMQRRQQMIPEAEEYLKSILKD